MFAKFASIGLLVVAGIMVADVLKNPTGTAAAFNGAAELETPAISGLLGVAPTQVK
jgi:hypothetical protein